MVRRFPRATSPPTVIGVRNYLQLGMSHTNPFDIAQAMWKSSTKIGIAAASNGKGAYYVVARYSPPGNFAGQKPY